MSDRSRVGGIEPPCVVVDLSTHPHRGGFLLRPRIRIDHGDWTEAGWDAHAFAVDAGPHLVEIQTTDRLHRHGHPPIGLQVSCGPDFVPTIEWAGSSPQIVERPR